MAERELARKRAPAFVPRPQSTPQPLPSVRPTAAEWVPVRSDLAGGNGLATYRGRLLAGGDHIAVGARRASSAVHVDICVHP